MKPESIVQKNPTLLGVATFQYIKVIKVKGKVSLEKKKSFNKTSIIEAIIKESPTKKLKLKIEGFLSSRLFMVE